MPKTHTSQSTSASQISRSTRLPTITSPSASPQLGNQLQLHESSPNLSQHEIGPADSTKHYDSPMNNYPNDIAEIIIGLIEYIKALMPKRKKKTPEEIAEKEARRKLREEEWRARQKRERVRYQWEKDGQAGWKVHPVTSTPQT